jgi:integrase
MAGSLTNEDVRDAVARAKKYWLSDGLNNLYLLVMPTGAKYWKFRFRFNGKNDELTPVPPYPRGSLTAARKKARELQVILDSGENPRVVSKKKKEDARQSAANTFKEAANAWHAFRLRAWKARTTAQVREYLDKDLIPALGRLPLDDITTRQLAEVVEKIDSRGAPDVAKKARQWFGSIYEYARANQWTKADPVRDLKAITLIGGQPKNYAHLPLKELPAFLEELRTVDASPFVKGAAYLALWTANRPGVTRTLRWSEVDLDEGLWTIEKDREEMKKGYKHVSPLSVQAVALLRELHQISGGFEYVFIGRNNPSKPISDGAVNGLIKRIGYRHRQTAHGFRHVVSSALNGKGYPADHIERQLAHGDPNKMRGLYNGAPYLEERRAMLQDWADMMDTMTQTQVAYSK